MTAEDDDRRLLADTAENLATLVQRLVNTLDDVVERMDRADARAQAADERADRGEKHARTTAFVVAFLLLLSIGVVGLAVDVYHYAKCSQGQTRELRAAAKDASDATLAYSDIRVDPTATPEQINAARITYHDAMKAQNQTQAENYSVCGL